MLNTFPVALITGTFLGFLSGLGTGGGSLLILWLHYVVGMSQQDARAINLLFFIPAALMAILQYKKQKAAHPEGLLPAILAGCICAAIGTVFSWQWNMELLKKLFGFLLLYTGIRELTWKGKNETGR